MRCLLCGEESNWYLCDRCLSAIVPYEGNRCRICSKPINAAESNTVCPVCLSKKRYFTKGFSLFNYEDEKIKKIIEFIKFFNHPRLLDILFYFEDDIKSQDIFTSCDYLIPVPMYKKDIRKRGYNQAVVMAKVLSKITKIPVNFDALIKIKQTEKQVGLNYKEREHNLSNAFKVNKLPKKIEKIVLIDDVFTTGSTINECAKTLLKKGISSSFFTFSTTPSGITDNV